MTYNWYKTKCDMETHYIYLILQGAGCLRQRQLQGQKSLQRHCSVISCCYCQSKKASYKMKSFLLLGKLGLGLGLKNIQREGHQAWVWKIFKPFSLLHGSDIDKWLLITFTFMSTFWYTKHDDGKMKFQSLKSKH